MSFGSAWMISSAGFPWSGRAGSSFCPGKSDQLIPDADYAVREQGVELLNIIFSLRRCAWMISAQTSWQMTESLMGNSSAINLRR